MNFPWERRAVPTELQLRGEYAKHESSAGGQFTGGGRYETIRNDSYIPPSRRWLHFGQFDNPTPTEEQLRQLAYEMYLLNKGRDMP